MDENDKRMPGEYLGIRICVLLSGIFMFVNTYKGFMIPSLTVKILLAFLYLLTIILPTCGIIICIIELIRGEVL